MSEETRLSERVEQQAAKQAGIALREQFEWWLEHSDEQDIPVPRWMAKAWLKAQGVKS